MVNRNSLQKARLIVCKIGTHSVLREINGKNRFNYETMFSLASQVASLQEKGYKIVWVSSGAIGLGNSELNWERSRDLIRKQVASAVGQPALIRGYQQVFNHYGLNVAQVLLTPQDNSERNERAKKTIEALLDNNIVPIINENDVISTEEITYGDNDLLSARKANLLSADALILLSHINGIYKVGSSEVISELRGENFQAFRNLLDKIPYSHSANGSGGISSKIQSAGIVENMPVVIASASEENVLLRILNGDNIGTFLYKSD